MKHVPETGLRKQPAMGYLPMQPNGVPLQINYAVAVSCNDRYGQRQIFVATFQSACCPRHQPTFLSGCAQLAGSKHQRQRNG